MCSQQWIEKIEPLLYLFTNERNHEVWKYGNPKETKSSCKKWNGYKVMLHYDPVILSNKKVLCSELNASWAKISKLWLRKTEKSQKDNKQPCQLNVFQSFLSDTDSSIQCSNVCKLLQILIATPCNTCIERGYLFLQMVCAPKSSHLKAELLETLFLLAPLQLPVKNSKEYDGKIKLFSWTY